MLLPLKTYFATIFGFRSSHPCGRICSLSQALKPQIPLFYTHLHPNRETTLNREQCPFLAHLTHKVFHSFCPFKLCYNQLCLPHIIIKFNTILQMIPLHIQLHHSLYELPFLQNAVFI